MNAEETAQTLITNAGFRDFSVIPTRVVKGMLIEALRGANEREQKIVQMLANIASPQPWPWDHLGTGLNQKNTFRRVVEPGIRPRAARLENEVGQDISRLVFWGGKL